MLTTLIPSINQLKSSLLEIKNIFQDLDNETTNCEASKKIVDLPEYLEALRFTNDIIVVSGGDEVT